MIPLRNLINKRVELNRESFSHKLYQTVFTFILINFAWIFFRANRFLDAFKIVKSIFSVHNWWILFDDSLFNLGLDWKDFMVLVFAIMLLLVADLYKYKEMQIRFVIMKHELWFRWTLYIVSIMFILVFGIWGPGYDASTFIYFQF